MPNGLESISENERSQPSVCTLALHLHRRWCARICVQTSNVLLPLLFTSVSMRADSVKTKDAFLHSTPPFRAFLLPQGLPVEPGLRKPLEVVPFPAAAQLREAAGLDLPPLSSPPVHGGARCPRPAWALGPGRLNLVGISRKQP